MKLAHSLPVVPDVMVYWTIFQRHCLKSERFISYAENILYLRRNRWSGDIFSKEYTKICRNSQATVLTCQIQIDIKIFSRTWTSTRIKLSASLWVCAQEKFSKIGIPYVIHFFGKTTVYLNKSDSVQKSYFLCDFQFWTYGHSKILDHSISKPKNDPNRYAERAVIATN